MSIWFGQGDLQNGRLKKNSGGCEDNDISSWLHLCTFDFLSPLFLLFFLFFIWFLFLFFVLGLLDVSVLVGWCYIIYLNQWIYIHIISYGDTTIMYADVVCMDCILFILPGPSNDYICGSNSMDVVCSMQAIILLCMYPMGSIDLDPMLQVLLTSAPSAPKTSSFASADVGTRLGWNAMIIPW